MLRTACYGSCLQGAAQHLTATGCMLVSPLPASVRKGYASRPGPLWLAALPPALALSTRPVPSPVSVPSLYLRRFYASLPLSWPWSWSLRRLLFVIICVSACVRPMQHFQAQVGSPPYTHTIHPSDLLCQCPLSICLDLSHRQSLKHTPQA